MKLHNTAFTQAILFVSEGGTACSPAPGTVCVSFWDRNSNRSFSSSEMLLFSCCRTRLQTLHKAAPEASTFRIHNDNVLSLSFVPFHSHLLFLYTAADVHFFNFWTIMFSRVFLVKMNAACSQWLIVKDKWLTAKPEIMLHQGTALMEVPFTYFNKRFQALQANHTRKRRKKEKDEKKACFFF